MGFSLSRLTLFKINAIMLSAITVILIFTFPETLYSRDDHSREEGLSYWKRLTFHGKVLDRPLKLSDWGNNFIMMKYWAVIIPCVYYATYVHLPCRVPNRLMLTDSRAGPTRTGASSSSSPHPASRKTCISLTPRRTVFSWVSP
jgi:hypothetical protein